METLPSEIITQILGYLPFDDRRELARVNQVFNHASSHPLFLRNELFNYEEPYEANLNNFNDFKNMLLKSRRKLFCLKFVRITYIDDLTIFTNLGNHIMSLSLIDLELLNDSFLNAITQFCSNLEKLELINVMNVILTDNDRKPILKLTSITLDGIRLSDRKFNLIMKLAPNLKDLSILSCSFVGVYLIMEMFYPHHSNSIDCSFTKYNSNDIFTLENILHHLNNFVRLNSLRLNQGISIFYRIQPIQLEIKSLSLNLFPTMYDSLDFKKLNLVLGQYVFLQQLEIFNLPVGMLSIVSKLYNLRHLTLSYIANGSNHLDASEYLKSLVESLKNLKYMRTLSFSRGFDVINGLELPIYPFLEFTLKSLTSLDCSLDSSLGVLKFGENLTSLRIRNGAILKVEDLQLLFRNFTYLKHLWIDNCSVLNDDIFIKLPIFNLKELITLKIIPSNISHRCLRNIKNSRLKVLTLTDMSLEPCSTQEELNEFKHSVDILSRAVPKLTQLNIPAHSISLKKIDESLNNLTYFKTSFKALLTTYFERLKILKLW